MTVQNEPSLGIYPFIAIYYSAEMERDHIKLSLGPALRNSVVGRNVQLMIVDDGREHIPLWSDTVNRFRFEAKSFRDRVLLRLISSSF